MICPCGRPLDVPDESRNLACVECKRMYQVIWFRGEDAMSKFQSWRIKTGWMTKPMPPDLIAAVEFLT